MSEIRVICCNPKLTSHGLFGTIVGHEQPGASALPVRAGVVYDVIWLNYPDEGSDEIDGGNLRMISEVAFQTEALERKLDSDA